MKGDYEIREMEGLPSSVDSIPDRQLWDLKVESDLISLVRHPGIRLELDPFIIGKILQTQTTIADRSDTFQPQRKSLTIP